MSIRIRTVNGVRIAICAAETAPVVGDIYLDDADHYALAAKFVRDWQESGLMERSVEGWQEWPVMDSQRIRNASDVAEEWGLERKGKATVKNALYGWKNMFVPDSPGVVIGRDSMTEQEAMSGIIRNRILTEEYPLYDWTDRRIPENCEWLATNDTGETMAFVAEPSKDHPYQKSHGWGIMCFTGTNEIGAKYGYCDPGLFVFNSPGPLVGHVEKRPTTKPIYDWADPHIPKGCQWLATNDEDDTRAFVCEPTNAEAHHELPGGGLACAIAVPFHVLHVQDGKPETAYRDVGVWVPGLRGVAGRKEKRPLPKRPLLALGDVISDYYSVEDIIARFEQEYGVVFSLYDWSDPRISEDCMWLATSDNGNAMSFKDEPSKTLFVEKGTAWAVFETIGNAKTADEGTRVFSAPLLTGFKERRPLFARAYYWEHPYVQHWVRLNREMAMKQSANMD